MSYSYSTFMDTDISKTLKQKFLPLTLELTELLIATDREGFSHLQNYIYFAHRAIFNFTESILFLCENGKPNVAKVLLRSLFEVHIDVIYHQLGDSEMKLAFSTHRMFKERLAPLEEILKLIEVCPNLESKDPAELFNKEYLNKAIAHQKRGMDAVGRGNPNLTGTKHLNMKAALCDEGPVKNAEQGHFRRMYSLIYRYLSPFAHLNIEGLQAFVGQDEMGNVYFHDGDDMDFVAVEAVSLAIAFIKDLYDNKILFGDQLGMIKEIEEFIIQKNIKLKGDS